MLDGKDLRTGSANFGMSPEHDQETTLGSGGAHERVRGGDSPSWGYEPNLWFFGNRPVGFPTPQVAAAVDAGLFAGSSASGMMLAP